MSAAEHAGAARSGVLGADRQHAAGAAASPSTPGRASCSLKLENQNPGGSIKDRIGLAMIEAAERAARSAPGSTLVEATAGNTGLGLALVAARKGYRLILVIPDKMSQEKIFHLRAHGRRGAHDALRRRQGPPGVLPGLARSASPSEIGGYYVNQFGNPANPLAHETTTGPEIWQQMGGRLDAVVCGVGSGGTITGLSRYFARVAPDVEMVLADPAGLGARRLRQDRAASARPVRGWSRASARTSSRRSADLSRVRHAYTITDEESLFTARALLRERRHPRRLVVRDAGRRGAALLPRADARRSASSRSSATAATSTCRRCSTTTGCTIRASCAATRARRPARPHRAPHDTGRRGRRSAPTTRC